MPGLRDGSDEGPEYEKGLDPIRGELDDATFASAWARDTG